nr:5-hydroxytryptamine receptor 1B [Onthophagus taurus]
MAELRWLVPLFLAISSILAIVANSLLLLVFFKRRGLRTVSNRFVVNLLVTNVLSGIVLIPLLIINETVLDKEDNIKDVKTLSRNLSEVVVKNEVIIRTKLIENEEFIEISILNNNENNCFCYFSQIVTNLVCVASILGILLIAFDQYFAVIHPLRYHTFINKSKSLILLITTWIFSILISLLNLSVFEVSFWSCQSDVSKSDVLGDEVIFAYFYFVLIFLVPFLIICSVYFKIYFAAHQNSERMRKSLSNNQLIIKNHVKSNDLKPNDEKSLPRVHSAPNIPNLSIKETKITRSISDRATSNNIIVTIKSKLSNASVFKYREESRTAKISILVIFMVLICYFPYGVSIILNVYLKSNPPINFNLISIVLLIISNLISPFLFAYRSKRVQRELVKTFLGRNRVIKKEFEPFIKPKRENLLENKSVIPKVVVTCSKNNKNENDRRGSGKNWGGFKKKCNFISVPDSCLEARSSFSSASTQISSVEE